MKYVIIFALVIRFLISSLEDVKFNFNSDEFIELVNANATTWTAGRNFHKDVPLSYINGLSGVLPELDQERLSEKRRSHQLQNISKVFDARSHWPYCSSLENIRNQGHCGSCWAVAAAAAMSDRICIASEGKINFYVSDENLLTCCSECAKDCKGGSPIAAWKYWVEHGVVSGGNFGSHQGCQPYLISSWEDYHEGRISLSEFESEELPPCSHHCEIGYSTPYSQDLSYGQDFYRVSKDVKAIQSEILLNGPIEASFTVYEDFYHYKEGIYYHCTGVKKSNHALKIIGWGEERGTPYWLAANSWGPSWGDGGFVKFLRGENHCKIEEGVVAGMPKL